MSPIIDGGGAGGFPGPSYPDTETAEILGIVAQQLQDITGVKWTQNDVLIPYLNLAILEIINLKPEAYPITQNVTLLPGPVQSIPPDAFQLLDVVCNMGADGMTRGATIFAIKKKQIDEILPGWMTFVANNLVSYIITDERAPKTFYIFPPQPDPPTQQVQVILSMYPNKLATVDDEFPLDNSYKPAVIDYLVYRSLIEETTIPNAINKAQGFYQKFLQDLGIKTAGEKQVEAKGK